LTSDAAKPYQPSNVTRAQKSPSKRKGTRSSAAKDRRRKFVQAYVGGQSGAQAVREAGFKGKWAETRAHRLLQEPEVQAAVQSRREEVARKLGITKERILAEYARLSFSDIKRAMTWGPNGVVLKESKTLKADVSAAIAEVTETRTKDGGSMRVKMHDKKGSLDMLAKHLGLITDEPEREGQQDNVKTYRLTLVNDTPTETTPSEKTEDKSE
jgi:phage terminase small subunit